MANFKLDVSNWPVASTFFTQEMLKYKILASEKCYSNYKHTPELLKKYKIACFSVFESISKLEKTNSLKKKLEGPIKQMGFKRLTE